MYLLGSEILNANGGEYLSGYGRSLLLFKRELATAGLFAIVKDIAAI